MKKLFILLVLLFSSWQTTDQTTITPIIQEHVIELPIGNQNQYDHVVEIYQNLLDKGVHEHAAFELVNQKVAEKGWTGYATGDNKKYDNVNKFTDHLIEWHGRMYPKSLEATNFEDFYKGIVPKKGPKYNIRPEYKYELLKTRKGTLLRINHYRQTKNKVPLK